MPHSLWAKITRSNFIIRLRSWEYWPFGIIQFPFFIFYFYLSLKSRSLVFFSASNPGIVMGGMFGESKFSVLNLIPKEYIPQTILVKANSTPEVAIALVNKEGMHFPIIAKPDIGERGFMVRRLNNAQDLAQYMQEFKANFILQALVASPIELGIFYCRFPNDASGKVTSIVAKEMLSVTGDGQRTVAELIWNHDRAKLQWKRMKVAYQAKWDHVLAEGETITLVQIGNHALGTKFLNGEYLITPELSATFDRISKQIPGFYFGRYDIRVDSTEDLNRGKIKIMELNGCGAEPAHIYDPSFKLMDAMKVMYKHWSDLYTVSKQNNQRGIPYLPFREAWKIYCTFKAAMK